MYISLIQNAALLVALSAFYSLLVRMGVKGGVWIKVSKGILFGAVAVAGMLMPFHYAPGIIYDGRSIILTMAGLFGGAISTAVAMVIAGAYRVSLGGPGMWAGLATIIGCPLVGLAFRRMCGSRPDRLGIPAFFGLGVATHTVMLFCQLLIIPWPAGLNVIQRIWLPVMLVFPSATVLMGLLLWTEERRLQAEKALRELTQELERRVAERTLALTESNRSLEDFAYSISHDLRAPLRAITGFAEIIARRYKASLNDEARCYLDNIIDAASRMEQLITDLLAYSRLSREATQIKEVSLSDLIREILFEFESSGAMAGAEINVDPDLPVVYGTSALLRQIFSNLIGNALKYRRKETAHRVEIRSVIDGPWGMIEVVDNGIGIASEYQDKIFNIFQRLHSENDFPGTGIGLAIAKKAVNILGGNIVVRSVPDKGSVFVVKLKRTMDARVPLLT